MIYIDLYYCVRDLQKCRTPRSHARLENTAVVLVGHGEMEVPCTCKIHGRIHQCNIPDVLIAISCVISSLILQTTAVLVMMSSLQLNNVDTFTHYPASIFLYCPALEHLVTSSSPSLILAIIISSPFISTMLNG